MSSTNSRGERLVSSLGMDRFDSEFFEPASPIALRIALVQPLLKDGNYLPSLGIMTLAALLLKKGFSVKVFDQNIDPSIEGSIQDYNPIIVGFTAVTAAIERCHNLALSLKEKLPEAIFVVGGPHVNALPKETLEKFPCFSFAFVGESEFTFPLFCERLARKEDLTSIPQLVWRQHSKINYNREPHFLSHQQLDDLPFPAWHLLPLEKVFHNAKHGLFSRGKRIMPVMTTRGCPNYCGFCARNLGFTLRKQSIERTLLEVKWLYQKYQIDEVYFEDDTFTQERERALELLGGLSKMRLPIHVKFANGLRADKVDQELLDAMKAAGVYWIGFGIESGSVRTQKLMMKGLDLSLAKANVSLAKSNGFYVGSNCIIGYPGESEQDVKESLRYFLGLGLDSLAVVTCVPFPGTTAWQVCKKNGWLTKQADRYENYWFEIFKVSPLIETPFLPAKKLQFWIAWTYIRFYFSNFQRFSRLLKAVIQIKAIDVFRSVRILRSNSLSRGSG